jgi:uncharacterized iron-regulated protein
MSIRRAAPILPTRDGPRGGSRFFDVGAAAKIWLGAAVAAVIALSFPTHDAAAAEAWLSQHFQDHPLAGTIWTSEFRTVTFSELETAVSKAGFVLLGEIHTNPDHHRLQARLIDGLIRNGRHPAVVFEMIPAELQTTLDRYLLGSATPASGLGKVLRWAERGWPDWTIYQPIAEAALAGGLPLLGGGLDDDEQKTLAKTQPPQQYAQMMEQLGLTKALGAQIADAEGRDIKDAHCNLLPEAALEPMMRVQRARDAYMAETLEESAKANDGAVLIAGAGHVRRDWGVPQAIRRESANANVVSIAFLEVAPERSAPSDYIQPVPGLEKPYDFLYFTPRGDLTDHCAELAKQLKAKKARPGE